MLLEQKRSFLSPLARMKINSIIGAFLSNKRSVFKL